MDIETLKKQFNYKEGEKETISYKCNLCKDAGWIIKDNKACECTCMKQEKIARRWKRFGVDPEKIKKINKYETMTDAQKNAKHKAANYIKNYESSGSIAFLGNSGAGKTHLSLGIGKAMLEQGKQVIYMPYLEAIKELKNKAMDEDYNSLQAKYINADLLIIDDLFKDKIRKGELGALTEVDMKHIYPIINQRYINNKKTIYSSECDIVQLLKLDEALTGRILESCKENIVVFKKCKENNYRLRFIGGK